MLKYTVLLRRNEEVPGYSVLVPQLPGCFSQGRTLDEALDHAREAIECHLEGMAEDGEELPVELEPFIVALVGVEPPERVDKGRAPVDKARFIMRRVPYSLTKEDVVEGVGRLESIPVPNEKRLWYVKVKGKELPIRWFMQELLGVGAVDVVLGKGIDVFKHLGFEVLYKGKKQPTWQKRKSA